VLVAAGAHNPIVILLTGTSTIYRFPPDIDSLRPMVIAALLTRMETGDPLGFRLSIQSSGYGRAEGRDSNSLLLSLGRSRDYRFN
jgi:hypothetical protein